VRDRDRPHDREAEAGAVLRPRPIAAEPPERLRQRAARVVRVSPAGDMAEFPIPGSDPVGIVVGPDGTVWVAEDDGNQIARLLPPAM
jgi:hypothetical protein